ncbi:Serine/threonine-protein kinase D [Grimontia celer]|uniref:Serine/threonine-protein kinase D n=1 Tax=Grimontia celer TaxID=1796497 RepID=A0A128EVT6_9GAMM|nr:phosphotransferase [Grimontia celer]CZF78294.1 Serine/threonine-protein kinase D [Grimontia celer]
MMNANELKLVAEALAMKESWQEGTIVDRKYQLSQPLSSKPVANAYLATELETGNSVVLRRAPPGAERGSLEREWEALNACKGEGVQEALSLYPASGFLSVSFYANSTPLIALNPEQAEAFPILLPKILKAISHCHKQGWIHGDIKPSNVIWDHDTNGICLIDFGAALPIGLSRKNLAAWHMSKGFSPDSQVQGAGIAHPSDDWFALIRWIRQLDDVEVSEVARHNLDRTLEWLGTQM